MQTSTHGRLTRSLSHVPITGLALFREPACGKLFALAGVDGDVLIYECDAEGETPSRLVCGVEVFDGQPVHGIQVRDCGGGDATVLVWGCREVAFFTLGDLLKDGVACAAPVVATATAPDWICDGAISPFDPHVAMLATAHNEVVPLRYSPSRGTISLGEATFPSRAMLFTARITWESSDSVLVAGGTVFGHIIVWRHRLGSGRASELLFNLTGFEGSIFGVDISSLIGLSDGTAVRLLAGCSDDRTIRVWDITERGGLSPEINKGSRLDQDIDTGFGGDHGVTGDSGDSHDSRDAPAPLAVAAMGHASRIWGVQFAPSAGIDTFSVCSFGEDAVTQRWLLTLAKRSPSIDGDSSSRRPFSGKLSHGKSYSLHHGKHLWSHTVLVERESMTIATGGADSQINLITENLAAGEKKRLNGSTVLDVQIILQSTDPPASPPGAKEIIGRYDFLAQDRILVTTSQGRVFLGSIGDGAESSISWQEIAVGEATAGELKSCYVLRTIGDGTALLGTTSGKMYLFQLSTREVHLVASLPGKIVDINRLSPKTKGEGGNTVGVLVFLLGQADSHYLTLDLHSGSFLHHERTQELDARFVATSAAMINGMIVMGSRHGWLSMLKRDESGSWRPISNLATRSFDSITAIVALPQRASSGRETCSYILVTSKDGKYRIYEIKEQAESLRLELCHETSPPFGPVITGAWFTKHPSPELMLCGFRSKSFVVWNESRREEVANIDCGGAHRTFQFAFDEADASRYKLAFTKTSKLSIHSFNRPSHRSLRTGVHGREIKALSSNGRYVASGAEDTTIRIWEHHHRHQGAAAGLTCVATMKAHVTGIQRLAWFEEDYLFSSAGNEEFFVWRVRKLADSAYEGLAVFCESDFTEKSADGDLRIMDFDVCREDGREDGGIMITMALSNSTLKTYRYTCTHGEENSNGGGHFELVAEGSYVGSCLTQVRHLDVRGDVLDVLVASTDGHVTLWHAEWDEQPQHNQQVGTLALAQAAQLHQNSIKSLDMLPLDEGILIFTGGDDNAVGIALLERTSPGNDSKSNLGWKVSSRGIVRRGHAAAVTGVLLVRSGSREGKITGVSVGNDQRIKNWRISTGRDMRITLLDEAYTGVADAGDLALVDPSSGSGGPTDARTARIMVGGVGMETWSLSLD